MEGRNHHQSGSPPDLFLAPVRPGHASEFDAIVDEMIGASAPQSISVRKFRGVDSKLLYHATIAATSASSLLAPHRLQSPADSEFFTFVRTFSTLIFHSD